MTHPSGNSCHTRISSMRFPCGCPVPASVPLGDVGAARICPPQRVGRLGDLATPATENFASAAESPTHAHRGAATPLRRLSHRFYPKIAAAPKLLNSPSRRALQIAEASITKKESKIESARTEKFSVANHCARLSTRCGGLQTNKQTNKQISTNHGWGRKPREHGYSNRVYSPSMSLLFKHGLEHVGLFLCAGPSQSHCRLRGCAERDCRGIGSHGKKHRGPLERDPHPARGIRPYPYRGLRIRISFPLIRMFLSPPIPQILSGRLYSPRRERD